MKPSPLSWPGSEPAVDTDMTAPCTASPTIRPSAHIFVGSKARWFTITDDLPQHQEFG